MKRTAAPRPEDFPQTLPPQVPDRTSLQVPGQMLGGYPTTTATPSRDFTYFGGPVKRARTSMDYGTRNIYDIDGRMVRQMDAYSQAAMYPNQPYQTLQ